ncbi:2-oxoglutarate dehydrogenase E1 component [Buchnera aphidicola (Pemphigus obesinymphae)]|uniref:2-oxoglutarate dehydrogenase E1 component n=1 Tax=Buchnera aphidicola TaxID=9 RepID=UPI0022386D87|nr:2-oxoglutarate dehydrogenase E1 component [Buchnera aphidicola]MCW5196825.1 2-oxoglutarate dehydrogenase E1 component [Buchnera aphidicola (Pemphigus obesinymphae)]
MKDTKLISWLNSSYLSGDNQTYIQSLYDTFLINPNSVEKEWRIFFSKIYNKKLKKEQKSKKKHGINTTDLDTTFLKKYKISQLIDAFRKDGHKNAHLDPLNLYQKKNIPNLNLNYYNLLETDLLINNNIIFFNNNNQLSSNTYLYQNLKEIYCNSIGFEYMHIENNEEKIWIQNYIECFVKENFLNKEERKKILKTLICAEELEIFLSKKFPGAKRFSLEGSETLIPMLHEIINYSGSLQVSDILLGMAHRGRLNVLINVFGKKERYLFNEFSNSYQDQFKSGDVKYHLGYHSKIKYNDKFINLILKCNPSHLEIINPVVMGCSRAHIDMLHNYDTNKILSVVIHGDASISGQGIVQETLNMSQTQGYNVGGSIHLVINNQIGFTTSDKKNLRSSDYCTDIAKMTNCPIFHVNADDPEAALFVTRMALDFRFNFKRDIFIDLVCYRRRGHNEADDPNVTQPVMYEKINKHPTVQKIYQNYLILKDIINKNYYDEIKYENKCKLEEEYSFFIRNKIKNTNENIQYKIKKNIEIKKINFKELKNIAISINTIPYEIDIHPKVKKIYQDRLEMIHGRKKIDWGTAENLAYASLVSQGISCRLSGEDIGRGTFFHRHSVIHNQSDGSIYIPINNIKDKKGKFYIWDSVLSEESVLAFEYGYSITNNNILTVWEAQFGDFANVAQVVIDQFISSGEQKWGYKCGLVMLLPHGYEGQGPEHSSARLERYLQLAAEDNIAICIPSTSAQIYHMLRCQVLQHIIKPLIIMSPKSLLRHPLSFSDFTELQHKNFLEIIDEIDSIPVKFLKQVIFCSGKIYYDLLQQRRINKQNDTAIIRIEKLYPFPKISFSKIMLSYTNVLNFAWCQEEPCNQGAWNYIQHHLQKMLPINSSLKYIGRPASSSPAVGNFFIHQKQQKEIVNDALNTYLIKG